jgi:hypothetical protein
MRGLSRLGSLVCENKWKVLLAVIGIALTVIGTLATLGVGPLLALLGAAVGYALIGCGAGLIVLPTPIDNAFSGCKSAKNKSPGPVAVEPPKDSVQSTIAQGPPVPSNNHFERFNYHWQRIFPEQQLDQADNRDKSDQIELFIEKVQCPVEYQHDLRTFLLQPLRNPLMHPIEAYIVTVPTPSNIVSASVPCKSNIGGGESCIVPLDEEDLDREEPVDLADLSKIELENFGQYEFRSDYCKTFAWYVGDAQGKLIRNTTAEETEKSIKSMHIYSSLPPATAKKMAYQRELVNIAMHAHFGESANKEILGCKSSYAKRDKKVIEPGNQLSLEMQVPFIRRDGKRVEPILLSVSAPALDSKTQPEWGQYVDDTGALNKDAYRTALQTISSHIKDCAQRNQGHRVVLSAFGVANFLGGLSGGQKEIARNISAEIMADLIADLDQQRVKVAYANVGSDAYWNNVNTRLAKDGQVQIEKVAKFDGSIPGNWMTKEDIIVNAWDPHSVVGNGCKKDHSFDGYVGRSSLAHFVHSYACKLFSLGTLI